MAGTTWLTWPPIRRKRVAPCGRYLTVSSGTLDMTRDGSPPRAALAMIFESLPRFVLPRPGDQQT